MARLQDPCELVQRLIGVSRALPALWRLLGNSAADAAPKNAGKHHVGRAQTSTHSLRSCCTGARTCMQPQPMRPLKQAPIVCKVCA